MSAETITVTGQGVATGTPDMAKITIGVEHYDADLTAAWDRTSSAITAVIDNLKALQINPHDIQTTGLNVYRQHRPRRNGESEVEEYVVSNSLEITVRDLERVTAVVSAAVRTGANRLSSLSFSVSNPELLASEARRNAVQDARRRAEELAEALGREVGRPIQVIDSPESDGPGPVYRKTEAFAMAADMPVSGGTISETASVRVTFRLK